MVVGGLGKVLEVLLGVASVAWLNIDVGLVADFWLALAPDQLLLDYRLDDRGLMAGSLVDLQFIFLRGRFRPWSGFAGVLSFCLESRAVSWWDIFAVEVLAMLLSGDQLLRVGILVPTPDAWEAQSVHSWCCSRRFASLSRHRVKTRARNGLSQQMLSAFLKVDLVFPQLTLRQSLRASHDHFLLS